MIIHSLRVFKALVNLATWILNGILPNPPAQTHPQTKMAKSLFIKLRKVWMIEAYCDRFGDKNLLRLLNLMEKIVLFIGENDRYYRQWIGLTFLLANQILEEKRRNLTRKEFLLEVRALTQQDLSSWLNQKRFETFKDYLFPVFLSNHLFNLANLRKEPRSD